MSDPMIENVRRALGRAQPLKEAPKPPEIPDAIARLVARDANLVEAFIKSAVDAKFKIEKVTPESVCAGLIDFLQLHQCRQIGICKSPLFDRLGIQKAMESAKLSVQRWDESSLDAAYELDCGITDVYAAVAETGSLVIRPDPRHGRALSLVPAIHVAIVEAANILPDLIDLLNKVDGEGQAPSITFISGPSKTADIEGSLVTGVHGPGLVQVFLLQ